jgi:aspartate dehydrogenase
MKVGLIGCGAIGNVIAKAIDEGEEELVAVYDLIESKSFELVSKLREKPEITRSFDEFVSKDMDVVIEAASQQAVREYAERVLESGKDFMVMSVGAFVDEDLLTKLRKIAKEKKRRIYIPSGAVVGIDAMKAVSARIEEVILITRKHPNSLRGAPFFEKNQMDIDEIESPTLLFEGSAREAVKLFPQNVNIAAVISIAGIGFSKTKVRIIADPAIDKNIHEIRIRGEFGEIVTIAKNVKCPENPKTSYLAALSAVRTLRNASESIIIGT